MKSTAGGQVVGSFQNMDSHGTCRKRHRICPFTGRQTDDQCTVTQSSVFLRV